MLNLLKKKSLNYKHVSAAEAAKLIEKENHVVLDVRSPSELTEGSLPNHKMINFFDSDFKEQILKLDKTKTYLVYCRSGNRSGRACALMGDMGFADVYNLTGGITAWNILASVR